MTKMLQEGAGLIRAYTMVRLQIVRVKAKGKTIHCPVASRVAY